MLEFLSQNIEVVISLIIAPIITFFFSKKHFQTRELKSKDIENNSAVVKTMAEGIGLLNKMLDDLEKRYETQLGKKDEYILKLEEMVNSLKESVLRLEDEVRILKEFNNNGYDSR